MDNWTLTLLTRPLLSPAAAQGGRGLAGAAGPPLGLGGPVRPAPACKGGAFCPLLLAPKQSPTKSALG